MSENLTARTFKGLNWSYLSTITNAVLQIGFTAVMARLIAPSAYGLVAMAGIVLRFASYFTTMGIGPALIQRKDISSEDIRASFSFSVALGVSIYTIFWFSAPYFQYVFNNSDVVPVVRVMAFSMVIEGFSITSISLLRRQLAFRSIAIIETLSFGIGYVSVGIVMGLSGLGVWSLVVPALSQAALIAISTNILIRHSRKPLLRWRHYKHLISYGSQFSILSFTQFIYYAITPLILGRYSGTIFLGFYNNAQRLANLPFEYLTNAFNRVLFPSLSKLQAEPDRIKRNYLSAHLIIALLFFPATWGMILAAREIVLMLLGPNWTGSIALFQVLLVATPFTFLNSLNGVVFDATANLRNKFNIEIPALFVMLTLAILLAQNGRWIIICYTFSEIFRYVLYVIRLERIINLNINDVAQLYRSIARNTFFIVGMIALVHTILDWAQVSLPVLLLGQIAAGVTTLIVVTFIKTTDPIKREISNIYVKVYANRQSDSKLLELTHWYARKFLGISLKIDTSLN